MLDDPRAALETNLPPTDLQTLLLGVVRTRAAALTPAQVMQRWRQDRFVRPSAVDPRRLARLEARLWELLPAGFVGVELSPVVPLGVCSAVAGVDQNRVVSTVRGTEVVSDPTWTREPPPGAIVPTTPGGGEPGSRGARADGGVGTQPVL